MRYETFLFNFFSSVISWGDKNQAFVHYDKIS
jgi:hypothetical protein